jgi:micrococcal nuclease
MLEIHITQLGFENLNLILAIRIMSKRTLLFITILIAIMVICLILVLSYNDSTQTSVICKGNAACYQGTITGVYDGDTVYVDGDPIRLALTSTPEIGEIGGGEAREFSLSICPIGTTALVDEDDGQTEGSFARLIGVVYCNGRNLNSALLEEGFGEIDSRFCDESEFSNEEWSRNFGC